MAKRFNFQSGNLKKLLATPLYLLGLLLSLVIPRDSNRWAFASHAGLGEGALPLALALKAREPEAEIWWILKTEEEVSAAEAAGFNACLRDSLRGFWMTITAGQIVVTHGLGDVNRFGVFRARIIQLWHGAPLKRLHFDTLQTTRINAPGLLQKLLKKMYSFGTAQVSLYVAGSVTAARRLRSCFRVAPGLVRVLGDPRHDPLIASLTDNSTMAARREAVLRALRVDPAGRRLVLYAPTWRDGDADPACPDEATAAAIKQHAKENNYLLVIRPHPLGHGDYSAVLGEHAALLTSEQLRDLTPHLGVFDALITDYSSAALDFSITERPIVWFVPDEESYSDSRGLYEPIAVTAQGQVQSNWYTALTRLAAVLPGGKAASQAKRHSKELSERFFAHPEGGAAERVLDAVIELLTPDAELVPENSVFFESFYGRQISDHPLALSSEITRQNTEVTQFWSTTDETQRVPDGAIPVLVGSKRWHAARKHSKLLVINDWTRHGFKRRSGQTVLQTWHGTMLKNLALDRPKQGLRTRIAVIRESARWSLMLSQNPHSTAHFRSGYRFRGEILELGYPRTDELAAAVVEKPLGAAGSERNGAISSRHCQEINPVLRARLKHELGINPASRVVSYIPTWRDSLNGQVDLVDANALAKQLGSEWTVLLRGHTRTHEFGGYQVRADNLLDVSKHDNINDVILVSDALITDYSSVMFDASVAKTPLLFFVPDIKDYSEKERGFSFDFAESAPGPLLTKQSEVVGALRSLDDIAGEYAERYENWRERFNPRDDGGSAKRVIDLLRQRGIL